MSVETAADPPALGGDAEPAMSATAVDTVLAAESVLSRRFGARIELTEPEDLGGSTRSVVLRVRVAASPFSLPRTLVLKRHLEPVAHPGDGFVREVASYQLFTALAPEDRMCPELFAHDTDSRLVVLEDLGRAPTLANTLLGDDARAAEAALLSWSRALGRMHATTAGREADFDALRRRLTPPEVADPLANAGAAALRDLPALLESELGVAPCPAVLERAERSRALFDSAQHRAFSPSDSCPDNGVLTGRGARYLDLEAGCVRNVLIDAAYLRVPFPSCWCPYDLPAGMTDAMLAGWRAEVRAVWPDLDDDEVLLARLLDAQLFWVWLATWQMFTQPDVVRRHVPGASGTSTAPPGTALLIRRWCRFADDARADGAGDVADHADRVIDALVARFGNHELPLYPAFRDG